MSASRHSASQSEQAPFDVVIRSGMVIDGSGGAGCIADVAVHDGKIVHSGALPGRLLRSCAFV